MTSEQIEDQKDALRSNIVQINAMINAKRQARMEMSRAWDDEIKSLYVFLNEAETILKNLGG
jgi:hypothetical protein